MHGLQNPDDIEHFRRIVPSQSRRLLDQITILGAGEAIVLGSAFHVPARVHIDRPEHAPSSQSSTPHLAWQPHVQTQFDMEDALNNWGVDVPTADKAIKTTKPKKKK
jgi:DNA helicase HerA-like ATPase